MQNTHAATALDALGHEARLDVYRTLVRAGDEGLAVGDIQSRMGDMPRSTLAHHLGKLVDAGLVVQHKQGATVVSTANYNQMNDLVAYLTDECCVDATSERET